MGSNEFDPYNGRPDRPNAWRVAFRVVGSLLGLAVSLYGTGLYALRCFDTCPEDANEDAVYRLVTGSIILLGLLIILGAAGAATRWAANAYRIVVALGVVIALVGAVSVFLARSIESRGSDNAAVLAGIVTLLVGVAVILIAASFLQRINRTSPGS